MIIIQGLLLSLTAGLATGIGGLLSIFIKPEHRRIIAIILGIVAGMMLAVSFISLIVESIENSGITLTSIGFTLGMVILLIVDSIIPHVHITLKCEGISEEKIMKGLVIAIGISLHNIPEGLAVASSYIVKPSLGIIVALVIGIHNIPEGLITAIPLREAGVNIMRILLLTLFSGLSEPLAALITLLILREVSLEILSLASSFAAGAMLYIVIDELIPEAYTHKENAHPFIIGNIIGVIIALLIINTLG